MEPLSPQERSGHTAFIHHNHLYVWGGFQFVSMADQTLPADEIWACDLDSAMWERRAIDGEAPPPLTDFCGANVDSTLYIFGGLDAGSFTNQMFSVDVSESSASWRRVTDASGTTPSPRNKHSCWVHRDRLIYFGGYACKTMEEVRNASSSSFVVDEMAWSVIGGTLFRCWGWSNEVDVFDTRTETWTTPQTQGPAPAPRGCHASAVQGNKGYISGGMETAELDVFCLDLESWMWTKFVVSLSPAPGGRSMHTMTAVSDHALLVYGGFSVQGNTLDDAWQFNTVRKEWTKMAHPHQNKPRVSHSACLGSDCDVVVFGGSSDLCIHVDTVAVLVGPSKCHSKDVLVFQTQPYSLSRLCEDVIGRNAQRFSRQLQWLPSKLQRKVNKRVSFFSSVQTA